jgi:hypothetical protein
MLAATIWLQDGWIFIRSDYCAEFVQGLKDYIPPAHRKWRQEDRLWTVAPTHLKLLRDILRRFGYSVADYVVEEPARKKPVAVMSPYDELLSALPDQALKKAYKAIIAVVHPDAGGDHETAVRVNRAWERICKLRNI